MGTVLLIVFIAAELALCALSCTKFAKKAERSRNKTILRACELALVIIAMLLPMGQKWRFAVCLAALLISLVIAGISYLIKTLKKDGRECSKAGVIAGTVWSVLVIGVSLAPAMLFTGYNGLETTGEYKVKHASAILVDSSRTDAYETDGSAREVPVHFYYPESGAENCPFVLFSHGSFGYYQSNSSLYMELASNGYVVASVDHPHYAFFTKDTDGKTIIVDMQFMQNCIDITNGVIPENDTIEYTREWLDVRGADVNFVLDTMIADKAAGALSGAWFTSDSKTADDILGVIKMTDMSRIGLTGHSIGGATAVKLGRERGDISAVIDIDGTMFSEKIQEGSDVYVFNDEPYPVPLLAMNNTSVPFEYIYFEYKDDEGRPYIDAHVLNNAVDAREYHIADTAHMDFTDLPLLSPALAGMLGRGTADPHKVIPEINSVCLDFFNYYLKGEGEITVSRWTPAE